MEWWWVEKGRVGARMYGRREGRRRRREMTSSVSFD